jgi:hypothetical protein
MFSKPISNGKIRLAIILIFLLSSYLYADETLHPANDQISIEYSLSSTNIILGDTLTASWTLVNNSGDTLNNLYWVDNFPLQMPVISYQILISGNEIGDYFFDSFTNHLFLSYDTFRWVIDEPSDGYPFNYKIDPSDSVELTYKVVCQDTGSFVLPFHSLCFDNGTHGSYTVADSINVIVSLSSNLGIIAGTITNTNGNPITNAEITIIENGRSRFSGYDGTYVFDNLEPGVYSLSVSHFSYIDTTLAGIEVNANETTICDIVLQPATLLYVPGDVNGDEVVIGSDVTYAVNFFRGIGQPPPDSVWIESTESWLYAAADANGSCSFIGSDVTFLVGYFRGIHTEVLYCPLAPPQ